MIDVTVMWPNTDQASTSHWRRAQLYEYSDEGADFRGGEVATKRSASTSRSIRSGLTG